MNDKYRSFLRPDCAIIHRTDEEFGELGNMAGGFPIALPGIGVISSSEALFQALRFPTYPDIQREILAEKGGYAAKCKAKKDGRRERFSRPDWDAVCVEIMRFCVAAKYAQHSAALYPILRRTGDRHIVEQTRTARGQFWGARPLKSPADRLEGLNHLGRIWMDIRDTLQEQGEMTVRLVDPPDTSDLLLLEKPVGSLRISAAPAEGWRMVEHIAPSTGAEGTVRVVWVHPLIPGLLYIPDFLSPDDHDVLLCIIDQQPWSDELSRRVQHYGFRYDYKAHQVTPSMYLGPLPDWLDRLAARLAAEGIMPEPPDQVICNEYQPGQGIGDHVDCTPCFKNVIASLSMGGPCLMNFTCRKTGKILPVVLEPDSLVVLQDQARYGWKHGIPRRRSDILPGRTIQRERRVSLTFRAVQCALG